MDPVYLFLQPCPLPLKPLAVNKNISHITCSATGPSIAFVLSQFEASNLLTLKKHAHRDPTVIPGPFSVDIGRRHLDSIVVSKGGVSIRNEQYSSTDQPIVATWAELQKMSKKGKVGAFECFLDGESRPTRIAGISDRTNRTASLHPCVPGKPPTLILGGFGMHRLKGTDPAADTDAKLNAVGKQYLRGHVLDICTGLGYTAISAADSPHVTHVTTIELDPVVISVQRRNPWSKSLFANPKIKTVQGDATQVLKALPRSHYDVIIHDPPANAMGGELYSANFYFDLWNVCKPGARVFHYIGDPYSKESGKLYRGVISRLASVGFGNIKVDPTSFGVTAVASGR
eukprot:GFKZ01006170.1.p1 GENE.GFKZ01006170.1~~GFKZ01006170.1.p1  ORF type:complete len:343 (+),score=27.50 GFKZ01006170.1:109-1137(+)